MLKINKYKEKQAIKQNKKEFLALKKYYLSKKILNKSQIKRLNYYMRKILIFCKTQKIEEDKKEKIDIRKLQKQLNRYENTRAKLSIIYMRIKTDEYLSEDYKEGVITCIGRMRCHLTSTITLLNKELNKVKNKNLS